MRRVGDGRPEGSAGRSRAPTTVSKPMRARRTMASFVTGIGDEDDQGAGDDDLADVLGEAASEADVDRTAQVAGGEVDGVPAVDHDGAGPCIAMTSRGERDDLDVVVEHSRGLAIARWRRTRSTSAPPSGRRSRRRRTGPRSSGRTHSWFAAARRRAHRLGASCLPQAEPAPWAGKTFVASGSVSSCSRSERYSWRASRRRTRRWTPVGRAGRRHR